MAVPVDQFRMKIWQQFVKNKIINDDGENKNCQHGLNKRVKSTKIGLKEAESDKACTRLIGKKLYELVQFLRSYEVHPLKFGHGRDRFKVEVDNKPIHAFRTDLPVQSSKLVSCALAQLIWWSYFI